MFGKPAQRPRSAHDKMHEYMLTLSSHMKQPSVMDSRNSYVSPYSHNSSGRSEYEDAFKLMQRINEETSYEHIPEIHGRSNADKLNIMKAEPAAILLTVSIF